MKTLKPVNNIFMDYQRQQEKIIIFASCLFFIFYFIDFYYKLYYYTLSLLPGGNRTWKLIEIRTDSPSCKREPVGLSDQKPARNVTLVWLCSRHKGWSGTGRAIRPRSRQKLHAGLVMFPT